MNDPRRDDTAPALLPSQYWAEAERRAKETTDKLGWRIGIGIVGLLLGPVPSVVAGHGALVVALAGVAGVVVAELALYFAPRWTHLADVRRENNYRDRSAARSARNQLARLTAEKPVGEPPTVEDEVTRSLNDLRRFKVRLGSFVTLDGVEFLAHWGPFMREPISPSAIGTLVITDAAYELLERLRGGAIELDGSFGVAHQPQMHQDIEAMFVELEMRNLAEPRGEFSSALPMRARPYILTKAGREIVVAAQNATVTREIRVVGRSSSR